MKRLTLLLAGWVAGAAALAGICLLAVRTPREKAFTELDAGIVGVQDCSLAWGDYDNDGDLDLALAGSTGIFNPVCAVYRNDRGRLTDAHADLPGTGYGCSLAWADYDNDGYLDLAVAGGTLSPDFVRICKVFRNDGRGGFCDINAGLMGVSECSLAWGDYDNDGKLDLAVAGAYGDGPGENTARIYRNTGSGFRNIGAKLVAVKQCSLAWADIDADGDLDLAIAGTTGTEAVCKIYRNDLGTFVESQQLRGADCCSLAWGDVDNDGAPDLALAGNSQAVPICVIYRNQAGKLVTHQELPGANYCSLAWADFDNDGHLDLAVSRSQGTTVYRNEGGRLSAVTKGLMAAVHCSLAWADYDNDGDLDLAIAGLQCVGRSSATLCWIYRNDTTVANSVPSPPNGLTSIVSGADVTLKWNPGTDRETPSIALRYNIRVGTKPGRGDILSGMADPSSGQRRVVSFGNVPSGLCRTLKGLPNGRYFWTVQSLDSTFAGSAWAPERSLQIETPGE